MVDTEVIRLHGRQTPGGDTPAAGGCLVALGLPFVGAGGLLATIAFQPEANLSVPRWSLLAGAGLVLGAGLLVAVLGVRAIRRASRRKRLLRAHPEEPWLADDWNPHGVDERPWKGALGGLAVLGLAALVLVPINWVAGAQPWPLPLFVGLFDLVVVWALGRWVYKLVRVLRYGAVRARFERFPFCLGETLELALACRSGFDRLDSLSVTLRHIRVASERSGGEQRAVHYQQWAETQRFDGRDLRAELRISFQLPDGDYGTSLGEPPARYWEIEVAGPAPGVDLAARFPVPVYVRPRPASPGA